MARFRTSGRDNFERVCSFCGKSADSVRRIISGPNDIFICDEC
ncbi:MAG: hypothetical protein LBK61_08325, partial [Spirochaetaceae bacterium]|nr:hypothetical protein [Spirochaetaceae bacterium]